MKLKYGIGIFGLIIVIALIFLIKNQSRFITEHRNLPTNTAITGVVSSNLGLPISGKVVSPQGVNIDIYVAKTAEQRIFGLSGFVGLPKNTGMIFVFPQVGIPDFWMKDMNFPLDIVWVDETYTIVDETINAQPQDYPKTYTPKAPVKYVLEIPAHTADLYGFTLGKKVFLTYDK